MHGTQLIQIGEVLSVFMCEMLNLIECIPAGWFTFHTTDKEFGL